MTILNPTDQPMLTTVADEAIPLVKGIPGGRITSLNDVAQAPVGNQRTTVDQCHRLQFTSQPALARIEAPLELLRVSQCANNLSSEAMQQIGTPGHH